MSFRVIFEDLTLDVEFDNLNDLTIDSIINQLCSVDYFNISSFENYCLRSSASLEEITQHVIYYFIECFIGRID